MWLDCNTEKPYIILCKHLYSGGAGNDILRLINLITMSISFCHTCKTSKNRWIEL